MPKIRRRDLPPALLDHLLKRIRSREISGDQLGELATWLDTEPEVPTGKWDDRVRCANNILPAYTGRLLIF
jgi:hypothetical protein